MKTISAKKFTPEFPDTLVVLKEDRGWHETAYLLSSLKNSEVLQKALDEPLDNCKEFKDVVRELDG